MHKTIRIIVSISGLISLDAVFHSPPSVYGLTALEVSVATSSMYNIIPIILHTDSYPLYV